MTDVTSAITPRNPLHPFWYGALCHDNFDQVVEHLSSLIRDREYAFVSTCGGVLWPTSVRVGQRLTDPPRISKENGGCHVTYADGNYVWGLHTFVATEREARAIGNENRLVLVAFKRDSGGEKCEIQQRNGVGEWLHWTIAVAL